MEHFGLNTAPTRTLHYILARPCAHDEGLSPAQFRRAPDFLPNCWCAHVILVSRLCASPNTTSAGSSVWDSSLPLPWTLQLLSICVQRSHLTWSLG